MTSSTPSGIVIGVVDSGPLYASVDEDDDDHARSVAALQRADLDLVVPALVVAEVTSLVGRRLGPRVEAAFLRGMASLEVEAPSHEDWARVADLVDRYADFPLSGTDASVVALAERLDTDVIVTLDHRHFAAVRSASGRPFRLLPD
jgi:predicted nucleic acid-binding protein